jgi:uridylate kinase
LANTPKFKCVLLKLSGEALAGPSGLGIDSELLEHVAKEIRSVADLGIKIGVVIGGGNFIRGVSLSQNLGIDRATSDYMGMLGTCMNSMALQAAVENQGVSCRVQSAIRMAEIAEPFIRRRALRHLEKGRVVIFAAGSGSPYFTTDTAAALRAMEINAEALIKGTKVDGIYDKDPEKHNDATKFERLRYIDVLQKGLKVMDSTAVSLCMDNNLPVLCLNLKTSGNMRRAILGENIGTLVQGGEE